MNWHVGNEDMGGIMRAMSVCISQRACHEMNSV